MESKTIMTQIQELPHPNLMRMASNIGIDPRKKKSDQLKQEIYNKISNDISQLASISHFSYFGNKDKSEMKDAEEIATKFSELNKATSKIEQLLSKIKEEVNSLHLTLKPEEDKQIRQELEKKSSRRGKDFDETLLKKVRELKKEGASRYKIRQELNLTWYLADKYFHLA